MSALYKVYDSKTPAFRRRVQDVSLMARLSEYVCGNGDDTAEDILDDLQLAYNEGCVSDECYQRIMDVLEDYLWT